MSASSSSSSLSPSLPPGEIQEVPIALSGPSSPVSHETEQPRSQAGPLPVKRGEIGYSETVNKSTESSDASDGVATSEVPQTSGSNNDTAVTTSTQSTTDNSTPNAPTSTSETASTHSKRSVLSFFKPRKLPSYFGIRLPDLIKFIIQLLVAAGTIACWVLAAIAISRANQKASNGNSNPNNVSNGGGSMSSTIFIHVLFGICLLVQLVFLERTIFHIRAQRWMHLHPGEILPTAYRNRAQDTRIPIAPWDRPPIPTYAAALAESGAGTGDVEDNAIAVQPPPAYGNTRGSRLLLTGFLNQTLREQRPESVHSQMSQTSGRPVSYRSHDEEWEVIRDADRADTLERTLATFEEGSHRPNGAV
jgi:hypothetical protein